MDTVKKFFSAGALKEHARDFLRNAYVRNQEPPPRRDTRYHLGWMFDVAVAVGLLIVVVGFLAT
jgi:hypothetical protein